MPDKLDLTGQSFGRLTVLGQDLSAPRGKGLRWRVECSCLAKNKKTVSSWALRSGTTTSCGCSRRKYDYAPTLTPLAEDARRRILTGQKRGLLFVKEHAGYRDLSNGTRRHYYWCECTCGNRCLKEASMLSRKGGLSCGCLRGITSAKVKQAASSPGAAGMRRHLQSYLDKKEVFEFTYEEFGAMVSQPCFYCGRAPFRTVYAGNAFSRVTVHGLDRVDNTVRGYLKGNTVPCCFPCNRAKMKTTLEVFAADNQARVEHLTGVRFQDPQHVLKRYLKDLEEWNTRRSYTKGFSDEASKNRTE